MNIQSSHHSLHFWFAGVFTVCSSVNWFNQVQEQHARNEQRKKMSKNQLEGKTSKWAMISIWSLINDVLEVSWFPHRWLITPAFTVWNKQDTYRLISITSWEMSFFHYLFCLQLTLFCGVSAHRVWQEFLQLHQKCIKLKDFTFLTFPGNSTRWIHLKITGWIRQGIVNNLHQTAFAHWWCWELDKQGHRSYRNNENCFEKQIV